MLYDLSDFETSDMLSDVCTDGGFPFKEQRRHELNIITQMKEEDVEQFEVIKQFEDDNCICLHLLLYPSFFESLLYWMDDINFLSDKSATLEVVKAAARNELAAIDD